jgi:hypothetical protein
MRNLSFQMSSENETRPLRDLNAERFRFRPATGASAEDQEYCSKVLEPLRRGRAHRTFGLRFHRMFHFFGQPSEPLSGSRIS